MDGSEALMKNNEKKKIHTLNGGEATKKTVNVYYTHNAKISHILRICGKKRKGK